MIKRFGEVAVDPETVVAVSKAVRPTTKKDESSMIVRHGRGDEDSSVVLVYISAAAAISLLDHFGKDES